MTNEFGSFLREVREKAGFSMGKLARLSGISQPYISQVEKGQRGVPSPEILKKLADPLELDYMELMRKGGYVPVKEVLQTIANHALEEYKRGNFVEAKISTNGESLTTLTDCGRKISRSAEIIIEQIKRICGDLEEKSADKQKEQLKLFRNAFHNMVYHTNENIEVFQTWLFDNETPLMGTNGEMLKLSGLLSDLQDVFEDQVRGNELMYLLTQSECTFNGHKLTDSEKKRIESVLLAMFPEYQLNS